MEQIVDSMNEIMRMAEEKQEKKKIEREFHDPEIKEQVFRTWKAFRKQVGKTKAEEMMPEYVAVRKERLFKMHRMPGESTDKPLKLPTWVKEEAW